MPSCTMYVLSYTCPVNTPDLTHIYHAASIPTCHLSSPWVVISNSCLSSRCNVMLLRHNEQCNSEWFITFHPLTKSEKNNSVTHVVCLVGLSLECFWKIVSFYHFIPLFTKTLMKNTQFKKNKQNCFRNNDVYVMLF